MTERQRGKKKSKHESVRGGESPRHIEFVRVLDSTLFWMPPALVRKSPEQKYTFRCTREIKSLHGNKRTNQRDRQGLKSSPALPLFLSRVSPAKRYENLWITLENMSSEYNTSFLFFNLRNFNENIEIFIIFKLFLCYLSTDIFANKVLTSFANGRKIKFTLHLTFIFQ